MAQKSKLETFKLYYEWDKTIKDIKKELGSK